MQEPAVGHAKDWPQTAGFNDQGPSSGRRESEGSNEWLIRSLWPIYFVAPAACRRDSGRRGAVSSSARMLTRTLARRTGRTFPKRRRSTETFANQRFANESPPRQGETSI